jgi:hypothetical protein
VDNVSGVYMDGMIVIEKLNDFNLSMWSLVVNVAVARVLPDMRSTRAAIPARRGH